MTLSYALKLYTDSFQFVNCVTWNPNISRALCIRFSLKASLDDIKAIHSAHLHIFCLHIYRRWPPINLEMYNVFLLLYISWENIRKPLFYYPKYRNNPPYVEKIVQPLALSHGTMETKCLFAPFYLYSLDTPIEFLFNLLTSRWRHYLYVSCDGSM